MRNLIRGSSALVRAWLVLGASAAIAAACSSDDTPSGTISAGQGGLAGSESQGGKSNGGGGKGGSTQGGTMQMGGKGGTSSPGGASSAGEAGMSQAMAGAGPELGGAGGQSAAGGAPGEAGAAGEAGAGGSSACSIADAKAAPVDQKQLGGVPDSWNVTEGAGIGQFITVGKTGVLAGVELSLAVACTANVGTVELNVHDGVSGTLLGKGSLAMSALACQTGGNLAANSVGAAFFDLSSQCIAVTALQKLRVELHLVGTSTCEAQHCAGGPTPGGNCNSDAQCNGIVISASQPSVYAGGSIEFKGVAGSADDNLNFKTFVAD